MPDGIRCQLPPPPELDDSTYRCRNALRKESLVPGEEALIRHLDHDSFWQERRSPCRRHICSSTCRNLCERFATGPIPLFGDDYRVPAVFRSLIRERGPKKKKTVHFIWQCVRLSLENYGITTDI